jgi:low affinity Fe/Cu permease
MAPPLLLSDDAAGHPASGSGRSHQDRSGHGREEHEPRTAGHPRHAAHDAFRRFAHRVSYLVGTPGAFLSALVLLAVWAAVGPAFGFSDTWQLVINTGTTIVTFLMVFLIQSTQNRDASAIHLKLDELIRANRSARNDLVMLEQMSDDELEELERQFESLRTKAQALRRRPSRRREDSDDS